MRNLPRQSLEILCPSFKSDSLASFSSNTDSLASFSSITDSVQDQADLRDPTEEILSSTVKASIEGLGVTQTAKLILEDSDLKDEIIKMIHSDTHNQLKGFLKHSILTASKKDRRYLLSLTPSVLCEELRDSVPKAYQALASGLLGVTDLDILPENQHFNNVLAMLYSTVAKCVNRKSSGYGLLMTTVARDGGMREDSIKLFCNLCHPRTAQKYDTEVLGQAWDEKLQEALNAESIKFNELRRAELDLDQLTEASPSQLKDAAADIEVLKNTLPPKIQCVWDNLNLRTNHRFERKGDSYSESNFYWMASLFIQERMSAKHMENVPGSALREPDELTIQEFVPTKHKDDYLFDDLVHYFANRLIVRHPLVFKYLKTCIEVSYCLRIGLFIIN